MFADDIALYKEISSSSDQELLQADLNQVFSWSCKWLLNLNPTKCNFYVFSTNVHHLWLSTNWVANHCPLSPPFAT